MESMASHCRIVSPILYGPYDWAKSAEPAVSSALGSWMQSLSDRPYLFRNALRP